MDKWANLSLKYKVLFAVLLTACGIGVYYKYVILVQEAEKLGLRQRCAMLGQEIRGIEKFAITHPDDQYQTELDTRKAQVDKLLPNGADISDFLLEAEEAACKSGIKLLLISPGNILPKQGYCEIPVEVIISGDYFHILEFYKRLQTSRLNTVKNINIATKQGALESKLSLVIFSYGNHNDN